MWNVYETHLSPPDDARVGIKVRAACTAVSISLYDRRGLGEWCSGNDRAIRTDDNLRWWDSLHRVALPAVRTTESAVEVALFLHSLGDDVLVLGEKLFDDLWIHGSVLHVSTVA